MDQFGMGASDAGPGVTYRRGELMAPGGDDERGSEVPRHCGACSGALVRPRCAEKSDVSPRWAQIAAGGG